jgi:hypothetical protein
LNKRSGTVQPRGEEQLKQEERSSLSKRKGKATQARGKEEQVE